MCATTCCGKPPLSQCCMLYRKGTNWIEFSFYLSFPITLTYFPHLPFHSSSEQVNWARGSTHLCSAFLCHYRWHRLFLFFFLLLSLFGHIVPDPPSVCDGCANRNAAGAERRRFVPASDRSSWFVRCALHTPSLTVPFIPVAVANRGLTSQWPVVAWI